MNTPNQKSYFYLSFLTIIALYILLSCVFFVFENIMLFPPDGSISANLASFTEILKHLLLISLIVHFVLIKEKIIYAFIIIFYVINFIYQISIYYYESHPAEQYLELVVFTEKQVYWASVLVCLAIIYRDREKRSLLTYFAVTLFIEKFIWWMFPYYTLSVISVLYVFDILSWILFGVYIWKLNKENITPLFKRD